MTPDELEKVVARLTKPFSDANHAPYPYTIESFEAFLLTELRAVHDAAIEKAAKRVENHLGKPCTLVCHCAANAKAIRALKIGDGQ